LGLREGTGPFCTAVVGDSVPLAAAAKAAVLAKEARASEAAVIWGKSSCGSGDVDDGDAVE